MHLNAPQRALCRALMLLLFVLGESACGPSSEERGRASDRLVLAAYSAVEDALEDEILPAFRHTWRERTGRDLEIKATYAASGQQAREVLGGLEADVVFLAMGSDLDALAQGELIRHDWRAQKWGGMVVRSIVAIGCRAGNPLGLRDWEDLAREDVDVLLPDPRTSGGAMWCLDAIYGAGLKKSERDGGRPDPAFAAEFLRRLQERVILMDPSARDSLTTFRRGLGAAVVTYESALLLEQRRGVAIEIVRPEATLLVEHPAALVDAYADSHGAREAAMALLAFLRNPEVQRSFARFGFRPRHPEVWQEVSARYPEPALLFDMSYLGSSEDEVYGMLFGEQGLWTRVHQQIARQARRKE